MNVPACLHQKCLADINPRTRFGCSIVAIHRDSGVLVAPTAMDQLNEGDIMVIIGAKKNIEQFETIINPS
jgi:trk system potassium uptake protein TrkA